VALAFVGPGLGGDGTVAIHRDQLLEMKRLLDATHEDQIMPPHDEDDMRDDSGNSEGGTGATAKGARGDMGSRTAAPSFSRFGIQGFKDNPNPTASRDEALREAATFGIIGLIPSAASADTPAVPWGRAALGNDARNAQGNFWGDAVDDALGWQGRCGCEGGLGHGEGGGGKGEGIGLGTIGTIGHGLGHGIGGGVGSGHGHLDGGHTPGVPFIRSGSTTVNGRLPPETIQRVVRQNFGRFRVCYADALRTNPSLEGRVTVKFVVDHDGSVASASDAGSDMTHEVTECVVRHFADLSFPEPAGGIVTVVYPLVFSPST
jgi:hypothetical protein